MESFFDLTLLFFSVCWMALFDPTQKLCLLTCKKIIPKKFFYDICRYVSTCIVNLLNGHSPICVFNKRKRVSLYACTCFLIIQKIFLLFQNLYVRINTIKIIYNFFLTIAMLCRTP